ncbi:Dyp-type peroxidase domain-containing protein [Puia sp. P3]|uniref:Dyp-type peroxidase domain-containing protein n=1 Tax=Puia sp. P3 TaxID=3423952 RepID=UPI003D67FCB0
MNAEPQNVLENTGNNTIFLVWNFKKDQEVGAVFQRICALVINLNNSGETRFPDAGATCVMGIGYDAWLRLGLPAPLPKELENFEPIAGRKHTAVSTPGDLHFHIRGKLQQYLLRYGCRPRSGAGPGGRQYGRGARIPVLGRSVDTGFCRRHRKPQRRKACFFWTDRGRRSRL